MQKNNKKIPLYQVRNFGDKISATFDFLRQNWRLWLQLSCYLLLPVCMLQAFAINAMMSGFIEGGLLADSMGDMMPAELQDGAGYLLSYLSMLFFSSVGGVIVTAIIYAMMIYDREHPEGLQDVSFRDLKDLLLRCMGRSTILMIIWILLTLVYVILMALSAMASLWFMLVGVLLLFFLAIALVHSLPVYIFENDTTAFGAIGRGFQLGLLTWGGTFLLMLVVGLLASVVQGVLSAPWYVGIMVKMIFMVGDGDSSAVSSVGYSFLMYILAVLQSFGTFLTAAFSVTALAYQYGSAAEQRDHISVDEDIERFEEMMGAGDEIANFENL